MTQNDKAPTGFEEIYQLFKNLPNADIGMREKAEAREKQLTKPMGALGDLENISAWVSEWRGKFMPKIQHPRLAVFAANHGVAAQGVSAFPTEVTAQMVANFQNGGACVNQLCALHDMDLRIYELNLNIPSKDFSKSPAMSEEECNTAINYGMMAVDEGVDFLCLGEMGIGNSTSAAAMAHALFGGSASDWTGAGTGVDGDAFKNKIRVVKDSVKLHEGEIAKYPKHLRPFHILRYFGGFELSAIVGAIIAARMARVPVMLDGYACSVAASILYALRPDLLDHCQVGHLSAEHAHAKLLEKINKRPLLQLNMRLGEGSGAALAFALVKSALACHNGMATFDEAMVAGKK